MKADEERFLWAKLQLQNLLEQKSDSDIREALRTLPRNLHETFERVLSRFTLEKEVGLGRQIFQWLAVARRPLTLEELQQAMATEPYQADLEPMRAINDIRKALSLTGNLTFVDEEYGTVHFVHGSVKQYLLSSNHSRYRIDLEQADEDAGVICLTYIESVTSKTQVANSSKTNLDPADLASAVIQTSLGSSWTANRLARSLLKRRVGTGKSFQHLIEEASGEIEAHRQRTALAHLEFLPYARVFGLIIIDD